MSSQGKPRKGKTVMSMSRKTRRILTATAVTAGISLAVTGVTTYAVAQSRGTAQRPAVTCHATQPVYNSNYRLVGTWQVTLAPGDEVNLPDEDNATCLPDGTLDVGQP